MKNEQIEPHDQYQPQEDAEEDNQLFESEQEMRKSLARLCYGDLYIIGKIWIGALRKVLLGIQPSIFPVVNAAKECPKPERPPPMKYTDLPIYKTPHYDFKTFQEGKDKCPNADVKLIHSYLYPRVKYYRRNLKESACSMGHELICVKNELCAAYCKKKREFINYMRDPENLMLRQAVVGLGGLTGYYVAGPRSISKRLIFTSLGLLAAGSLCFPKETDEVFRCGAYYGGKGLISCYNKICGKNFSLPEKLPCKDDLPPTPNQMKAGTPCPLKK